MKNTTDFRLFGIVGCPLSHTLSPAMQEAAFKAVGIKAFYLVLELSEKHLKKAFRNLSSFPLKGFNVTVPYKETVAPFLDFVTPEAKAIGAVNTVFLKGKKWFGANTDAAGFIRSIKEDAKFSVKGKKVVLFGAGGSARALVYGLCREKISALTLINRHEDRARKLAGHFSKIFRAVCFSTLPLSSKKVGDLIADADLVINSTSVGLKNENDSIVPEPAVRKCSSDSKKILFYDLIYRPQETRFLKIAKNKGHRTLNGLGMLLYQGAESFEYWTGRRAPVKVMRQALGEALAERKSA